MKKLRNRMVVLGMLLVGLAAIMAACGGDAAPTPTIVERVVEKEVIKEVEVAPKIKATTWVGHNGKPATTFAGRGFVNFSDLVTERTNGLLKLEAHMGAELGYKNDEAIDILERRAVDYTELVTPSVVGQYPELGMFLVPFFTTTFDEVFALDKLYRPRLDEILAERNQKCLLTYTFPGQHLHLKKAINALADLKGVKMRVGNPVALDILTQLDAAPLRIDFAEVYTAIQRGTVDGVGTSVASIVDLKGWELVTHVNLMGFQMGGINCITVSQQAWDELADPIKVVVLEVAAQVEREIRVDTRKSVSDDLATAERNGLIIHQVPAATLAEMAQVIKGIETDFFANNPKMKPIADAYLKIRNATG